MKHFADEEYDSMKDYEFNIMSHMIDEDKEDDYDGSLVFSHWHEDDNNDNYESAIKHFQD